MLKLRHKISLILILCSVLVVYTAGEPIVSIPGYGTIRGTTSASGLTNAFYGIPYAKAPARFEAPFRPDPVPNGSVLDATKHRAACMQSPCQGRLSFSCHTELSEDCLFLNIWQPNDETYKTIIDKRKEKGNRDTMLPVYVYIHGGAFTSGTGSAPLYDGEIISSAYGVIVVTINYRLGLLGWMSSPEHDIHGNYGLHDQQYALAWVQTFISQFGGDPQRITVGGQSAGAISIPLHMSVAVDALYHTTILPDMQSLIPCHQSDPSFPPIPLKQYCQAADYTTEGTLLKQRRQHLLQAHIYDLNQIGFRVGDKYCRNQRREVCILDREIPFLQNIYEINHELYTRSLSTDKDDDEKYITEYKAFAENTSHPLFKLHYERYQTWSQCHIQRIALDKNHLCGINQYFHKTVLISHPFSLYNRPPQEYAAITRQLISAFSCSADSSTSSQDNDDNDDIDDDVKSMTHAERERHCLVTKLSAEDYISDTADDILSSLTNNPAGISSFMPVTPTLRSPLLPRNPTDLIASRKIPFKIPILAGTTLDEAVYYVDAAFDETFNSMMMKALLGRVFGSESLEDVYQRYEIPDSDSSFNYLVPLRVLATDALFLCQDRMIMASYSGDIDAPTPSPDPDGDDNNNNNGDDDADQSDNDGKDNNPQPTVAPSSYHLPKTLLSIASNRVETSSTDELSKSDELFPPQPAFVYTIDSPPSMLNNGFTEGFCEHSSCHGWDLGYWFLSYLRIGQAMKSYGTLSELEMSVQIVTHLANFIHTGNPSTAGDGIVATPVPIPSLEDDNDEDGDDKDREKDDANDKNNRVQINNDTSSNSSQRSLATSTSRSSLSTIIPQSLHTSLKTVNDELRKSVNTVNGTTISGSRVGAKLKPSSGKYNHVYNPFNTGNGAKTRLNRFTTLQRGRDDDKDDGDDEPPTHYYPIDIEFMQLVEKTLYEWDVINYDHSNAMYFAVKALDPSNPANRYTNDTIIATTNQSPYAHREYCEFWHDTEYRYGQPQPSMAPIGVDVGVNTAVVSAHISLGVAVFILFSIAMIEFIF